MKISASIYSNKGKSVEETALLLGDHAVDMIHVDCKDDLSVMEDLPLMDVNSELPLDLHIITPTPDKYLSYIAHDAVGYAAFQYEPLAGKNWKFPTDINVKWGLSIVTDTPVDVIDDYASQIDFVLVMATIPGESGGKFAVENFQRIRRIKEKHPHLAIHVDGGVNAEVSFLLRSMGVEVSISGSFLFNSKSVAHALLELKLNETHSRFHVKDFMIPKSQMPVMDFSELKLDKVLKAIDQGKKGMVVVEKEGVLEGVITNADVRRGLMRHLPSVEWQDDYLNRTPRIVDEEATVYELLVFLKQQTLPLVYIPAINKEKQITGLVSLENLLKGEI